MTGKIRAANDIYGPSPPAAAASGTREAEGASPGLRTMTSRHPRRPSGRDPSVAARKLATGRPLPRAAAAPGSSPSVAGAVVPRPAAAALSPHRQPTEPEPAPHHVDALRPTSRGRRKQPGRTRRASCPRSRHYRYRAVCSAGCAVPAAHADPHLRLACSLRSYAVSAGSNSVCGRLEPRLAAVRYGGEP